MTWPLTFVISGGQTGADQGGLRAGRACGYRTGGTAPKGYRTDEGPMPDLLQAFGLVESIYASYSPRTWDNVRGSTGTVWFGDDTSPGGILTSSNCWRLRRPWLANPTSAAELRDWIEAHRITTLNVAGNRERTNPGIGVRVETFLREALRRYTTPSLDGLEARHQP